MPTIELDAPHEGQMEILRNRHRYNVIACGRRFGKTELGVGLLLKPALAGKPVAWFAPTYRLQDEAWERFVRVLPACMCSLNKQERVIRLNTGGRIDFWTLRQTTRDQSTAGRGKAYARVFVDEASFAPSLERDWNEAIRPTLTDYMGDAYFAFTPRGQNYAYRLYRRGQSGESGWMSFRMPTSRNPHIEPQEIANARQDMPRDAFAQEYEAEFLADAANPFGLESIRACVGELGDGPALWYGVDLARSHDWCVVIGLNQQGEVCTFARWQSDFAQTVDRVSGMIGDSYALIDDTGMGGPIVEQISRRCPNASGFTFTSTSKQQIMEGLAWAIQNRAVKYPSGEIVSELESFQYEYRASGVRYTAPSGLYDDCVCALALAIRCRMEHRDNPRIWTKGDTIEHRRRLHESRLWSRVI